ncbi:MAG: LLM class flavin-dependent oxidoreductase [Gammaproteobacteria bacterium]
MKIDFNAFMYCTVGRRAELESGMAGKDPLLYQRMLGEIAEYVTFADESGFAGWGHPEHHLQIEGFEASNDPTLMGMWIGKHSKRMRVITCGFVSTTHNPLRTAEAISTMDHMMQGRFGVGLVRGYQHRWVENLKMKPELDAVGPWNKDQPADVRNREHFAEWVDIVLTALREETFSYDGQFWQFPPNGFKNPHRHDVYTGYGAGVDEAMNITEIGIAPRPLQYPHPPLYGGFSASMRTVKFWAQYGGKTIIMSDNLEFCQSLWAAYREESEKLNRAVRPGDEACWGGIMICAKSDAEAKAQFADMKWFWETWAMPFGQPMPELLIGSPDTLCRRIEEASTAVPINEMVLLLPQGVHDRDQIMASLELFAENVIPKFS